MASDDSGSDDSDGEQADERIEVSRWVGAEPAAVFRLLCDPEGHVAIDSSGMLQSAEGDPVSAVGDTFVVHMDREALNDYPLGEYDVTVEITAFEQDREIAWTVTGAIEPPLGHVYGYLLEPAEGGTTVTSYYDWSSIDPVWREAGIFPILSEGALRATLGILGRTVVRLASLTARRATAASRVTGCTAPDAPTFRGPWSPEQVTGFLAGSVIPVRMGVDAGPGGPLVVSVWFLPDGLELVGATRPTSTLVRCLERRPECGFEVAADAPPVPRGAGAGPGGAGPGRGAVVLDRLLKRYLGGVDSPLARDCGPMRTTRSPSGSAR